MKHEIFFISSKSQPTPPSFVNYQFCQEEVAGDHSTGKALLNQTLISGLSLGGCLQWVRMAEQCEQQFTLKYISHNARVVNLPQFYNDTICCPRRALKECTEQSQYITTLAPKTRCTGDTALLLKG